MVEQKVDHNQLEELLLRYDKANLPLFIWGTTGIGKSQTVRRVAKEKSIKHDREFAVWNKLSKKDKHKVAENPDKYFVLMDIRLSQVDPSDLRGLPSLNGSDSVEWKVPFWLQLLTREDVKAYLFFDEINLAPPSIQASAYQLILDRALGEVSISNGVFIVSAGNRVEDKANVYNLPKPLQNRFGHCVLTPPGIDDWVEWATANDVDQRIITFLSWKSSRLFGFDPKAKEKAFPTPRTWADYCSPLIKGVKDIGTLKALASSVIGKGTAIEFISFLKLRKNIDFKDYLKHPEKVRKLERPDITHSFLSLVIDWFDKNHKKKDVKKLLQIANNLQRDEWTILLLKLASERQSGAITRNVDKFDEFKEISDQIIKYIADE